MDTVVSMPQTQEMPPRSQAPDSQHDGAFQRGLHGPPTDRNGQHSQQGAQQPMTNNGRDKIHWSKEVWDRIDKAVHAEMMRTRVAQKFIPIRPVLPRTTSVPF